MRNNRRIRRGLTTYRLKWIAVFSMVADHIGTVFFPKILLFRYIGRIAFPVFAFLLVEGFFHTRDVVRYLTRLGIFAVLSEIPYDLVFQGKILEFSHQNVFLTLFLGVFMMYQMSMPGKWQIKSVKTLLIMWVASVLHVDYSYMGILLIFIYYEMHRCRMTAMQDNAEKNQTNDSGNYMAGNRSGMWFVLSGLWNFLWPGNVQYYGVMAAPLILLYNGERGKKSKYFFYAFYPVHLMIIYIFYRYI